MTTTVSNKIKKDYGTITFFCKKHEINVHTFRQVIYGYGTSSKIVNLLKKHKYIKSADELKKVA
ncbi:hypothetical protein [Aliarcobacter cryaerophilus]|uniref:hypothetical protein n=1 Tax=Aliarcobacter cryaerophilus TaxID=28198 RepID=UPI0021B5CB65|nr:hypothetical protein [Aliarcobacter cryaerophilus]MCT7405645.1 hypothetical protein [Aliarcobacter cryaerophilus]MCT7503412.1 hypothetical protein [Aliarcobacter cryaerophilus]